MDTNFFAVSAMSPLTVAAAVPAAKVIIDTPASTVPTTVAAAQWGAPLV